MVVSLNSFNKEKSIAYVTELSNAIDSCSVALASELEKYELSTNTPEDVSARYWLMNFLEPLNKKELKSIVDGFLIPMLNEEQAKKIVKFLLIRFPSYYDEFTKKEPEKVEEVQEDKKIQVPEFVKDELNKNS